MAQDQPRPLSEVLRSVAGMNSAAIADRAAQGSHSIPRMYACANCLDFRWVHVLNEHGTWPKLYEPGFGKMTPCLDCSADTVANTARARTASLFKFAGLGDVQVKRFDSFEGFRQTTRKGVEAAELAKRSIWEWASKSGPDHLVVTGGTGVGKTHLTEAAAAHIIERGDEVVYIIWADFVFGFRENLDERQEHMRRLRDAETLIVDEILAARDTTSFLAESLQDLMGHRTHYGKRTVLAGNLVAEGDTQAEQKQWWVDRLGDRFFSRMQDKNMVKVIDMWECDDLRPHEQGEMV